MRSLQSSLMSDQTTKKLLDLLEPAAAVELRRAAVLMLGEVGNRDTETSEALFAAIDDADPQVRLHALEAMGKLKVDRALSALLQRVEQGGPEAEVAALAAARLGARGSRGLQEMMGHVAPGLRRKIAGALGASGTAAAETAALDALLDTDPGVVEAAVTSLVGEVPSLSSSHRQSVAEHLLQLLKQARKQPLPVVSETAVIRLLSALNESRAEPFFWDRIEPARQPEVRAAALQGLGRLVEAPSGERLKLLLRCATESDFRVTAPAMMILRAVKVTDRTLADWLPLLKTGDVAVRRLALEKVGARDTREVADALAAATDHPDQTFRGELLDRLGKLKHGPAALVNILLEAATPEQAWALVRLQQSLAKSYPNELRDKVLKQAFRYMEEGDRRAEPLLHQVRESNAAKFRERLEARALELRKKKQYDKALHFLRTLNRDPATGLPLRFEFASCALKCSAKDVAAEARAADAALGQFAGLLHHHGDEVLPLLKKSKWLDAEDLFYLGFHFTEKERQDKEFGGEVLKLAIQRSPRSQVAKDAKNKLKRAGLT
jgi:HEAT repeat protein